MKNASIYRNYGDAQTLGHFVGYDGLNEIFKCKTIELPWKNNKRNVSCIPAGIYICKKSCNSSGNPVYKLQYVINRDWIQIHVANFKDDILGCIGVGADFFDLNKDGLMDITSSGKTLEKMFKALGNEFQLTIT